MEEDESIFTNFQTTRQRCRRELRALELAAYSDLMSAFRASGRLDETKRSALAQIRSTLSIGDSRHRAEARRVANEDYLSYLADMVNGHSTTTDWTEEGYEEFPNLPTLVKYNPCIKHIVQSTAPQLDSLPGENNVVAITEIEEDEEDIEARKLIEYFKSSRWSAEAELVLAAQATQFKFDPHSSSSSSESEEEPLERRKFARKVKIEKKKKLPVKILKKRPASPDITDGCPTSKAIKKSLVKKQGVKRKFSIIRSPDRRRRLLAVKRAKVNDNERPQSPDDKEDDEYRENPNEYRENDKEELTKLTTGKTKDSKVLKIKVNSNRPKKMKNTEIKKKKSVKIRMQKGKNSPEPPAQVTSRRKSKLKEKPIIDDIVVEVRNYDDDDSDEDEYDEEIMDDEKNSVEKQSDIKDDLPPLSFKKSPASSPIKTSSQESSSSSSSSRHLSNWKPNFTENQLKNNNSDSESDEEKVSTPSKRKPPSILAGYKNLNPAPFNSITASNASGKKWAKLHNPTPPVTNSSVDSLGITFPLPSTPTPITTSSLTSLSTASSLARRPPIISGMASGMQTLLSTTPVSSSGNRPGILAGRKAQPHILAKKNTGVTNSANNANNVISSGSSNSGNIASIANVTSIASLAGGGGNVSNMSNVTSVSGNATNIPVSGSSVANSNVSNGAVSVTVSTTVGGVTSVSTNVQSLGLASVPTTTANLQPMIGTGARPGNIIFLQKSAPTTSTPTATTGQLPVKQPPRAVILRRANVGPRQSNVMILDVKNKVIANQIPPHAIRILNTPQAQPELPVMTLATGTTNTSVIQNQSPRKIIQATATLTGNSGTHFVESSALKATITQVHGQAQGSPPRQPVRIISANVAQANKGVVAVKNDHHDGILFSDVAYEEEVVTTTQVTSSHVSDSLATASNSARVPKRNSTKTKKIPPIETLFADNTPLPPQQISNGSTSSQEYKSGSSTDTASESDNSFVSSSTPDKPSPVKNISNFSKGEEPDIFQAALKSSGIVLEEFYDDDEGVGGVSLNQSQTSSSSQS